MENYGKFSMILLQTSSCFGLLIFSVWFPSVVLTGLTPSSPRHYQQQEEVKESPSPIFLICKPPGTSHLISCPSRTAYTEHGHSLAHTHLDHLQLGYHSAQLLNGVNDDIDDWSLGSFTEGLSGIWTN